MVSNIYKKLELTYVISALGYLTHFSPYVQKVEWIDEYTELMGSLSDHLQNKLKKECTNVDPRISILFNAFVENSFVKYLKLSNNMRTDAVYADSGGLQIVTAGKTVTEEIKKQIYKQQEYADYAMCFDVIPLETMSLGPRTKHERALTSNKRFNSEKIGESATATGQNIREQCKHFAKVGAKTKVIIIVQGNTAEDMVEFFTCINLCLDPVDWEHIGGLAIADTCMGNGELESVEMLRAAYLIAEKYRDDPLRKNVCKHLHVLGVGSVRRMKPILYLIKSGYLNAYEKVSFDSSSHSMTFHYGFVKRDESTFSLGNHKTKEAEEHFRAVYNFFKEQLGKYISEEDYIKYIFGTEKGSKWAIPNIKERIFATNDKNVIMPVMLCNLEHVYFQVYEFIKNLDAVMEHKQGKISKRTKTTLSDIAINNLLAVKNDKMMKEWLTFNKGYVSSKRILRGEAESSLEELMG